MLQLLRNEHAFTLVELVVLIILAGLLFAILIPRYLDLEDRAIRAEAQALLGSGRAAILLDFSDKILNGGQYLSELTDATTAPGEFDLSDVTDLENELQTTPIYPPQGPYSHPPNKGFRWYLVTQGSTAPSESPTPPVIDALIDITCDVSISAKPKKNDDCYVSKL